MKKREIWIEGTFAGEVKMENRATGLMVDDEDDELCEDWEERDRDEPWFDPEDDEDDEDEGDDEPWDFGESPWRDDDEPYGRAGAPGRVRGRREAGRASKHGDRPRSRNKEIGRRGEDAAARYLERMGYDILERNFSCPFGEADIIARDGESLVFVEVKTRTGVWRGFPSEAVDERKRDRYERIAGWYLGSFGEVNFPVRFDIIAIMVVSEDRAFIRHYSYAFSVGF